MGLTLSQRAIIEKARSIGSSAQGIALDDESCAYLIGVIVRDLDLLHKFPEIPKILPPFFGAQPLSNLRLPAVNFLGLFERLVTIDPNADTYFACLAALHKARLKYERILQTQPVPTIDQVGPRGLLQYGSFQPKALTPFILWRKWMFDIDNRAGQETGYLFEPIIAYAVGGCPVSASKSPVKRRSDPQKGRQVDCIRGNKAHEFKLRVTIAASGQGRWGEELEFPADCKASGFNPVLVVLDPTQNPKLSELSKKFIDADGEVYIGSKAWEYLESLAGPTLSRFLEKYVHITIQSLLNEVPPHEELPEMSLKMEKGVFTASIFGEILSISRTPRSPSNTDSDDMPEDVDDQIPGP